MNNQNNNLSPYYQTILNSFCGSAPCGESLEYDPAFLLLQSRLQPRMEAEYGDFIEAAEPINWSEVERDCRTLLLKSLDVRLIITLIRCRMRQHGAVELAAGLNMLNMLLQTWPDDLHPQLMDEGDYEPLMRANAFSELNDSEGFIADVRNLPLPTCSGLSVNVREFEKACIGPRDGSALPEAAIAALRQEWQENWCNDIAAFSFAQDELGMLRQLLSTLPDDIAPDFDRLAQILALFSQQSIHLTCDEHLSPAPSVLSMVEPEATSETAAAVIERADTMPVGSAPVPSRSVPVNRDDALARLREVRAWFRAVEPSSPIILLLDFAEKTAGKSFAELIRVIPTDMVSQLENDKE